MMWEWFLKNIISKPYLSVHVLYLSYFFLSCIKGTIENILLGIKNTSKSYPIKWGWLKYIIDEVMEHVVKIAM